MIQEIKKYLCIYIEDLKFPGLHLINEREKQKH